ncbi:hrp65 protein-like [Pieris napi]|uniref:hrp65 protein-like n=1 Tax=Pieris napi TaxID=78633 RepID=UPI001FBA1E3E|nr:hrp65 protein-like [Pieris napi]
MQGQAMNHFGHRGFGGPPQPQRQGGRRGNRGGGFRGNSRFEHNHRNSTQQGGQRPNEVKPVTQDKAPQQQATQQAPKEKEVINQQPNQQNQKPSPQQTPPKPQEPQTPKVNQNSALKQESKDNVDKATPNETKPIINHNQSNFQKNVNGNFGGPGKQGGWSQGNQGNKQGNLGQQRGPRGDFNRGQGGQGQGGQGQGGQGQGGQNQGPPGQGPARNQQRTNNWAGGQFDGKPAQREEHMLANKLKDLVGPLLELPTIEQPEVKFNGRSRLYIGNLCNDVTEEELLNLFNQFGETAELFLNKEKNFGFIKMDYRVNAEKAKRELDGKMKNGRSMRVRFAPHNSAVRIKNLPPFVSNELLYKAFEIFGKIERAYVRVDERGKTLGEGIVEFSRKPSALAAIRNCSERCFFLTSSLRPVIVENLEEPDEFDGFPEKNISKKHPEYLKAREVGPRFAEAGSFEHEYGTRWKQLHELHRQKEEALKKELAAEEEKLEAQMEFAKYEHETELLREQLRQREQDRERQKRSWEMAERAADERRETERMQLMRHEEELSQRMRLQDDELRRRQQENTLFVQAQRLNSMLDRQEQGMFDNQQPMDGGFRDQFDMPRGGFDDMPQNRVWEGRPMDDYPNKRRRF